jgi:hypothetical protein
MGTMVIAIDHVCQVGHDEVDGAHRGAPRSTLQDITHAEVFCCFDPVHCMCQRKTLHHPTQGRRF